MKTAVPLSYRARGFTALELIIVLVIGFSIIALSASKMGELFNASKITRATSSIMELATSVRSIQGQDGYGADGDITQQMIDNELVPKTLRVSNNTIQNEWNGAVEVNVIDNGQNVSITYDAIPKSACSKLATAILKSGVFPSLNTGIGNPLTTASSPQDILTGCIPAQGDASLLFTLVVSQ